MPLLTVDQAGNLYTSGGVNPPSDRNVKDNFAPVNAVAILEKVARLRLQTWTYTNDTSYARHLGPVAQDFKAAFGLGADDKHIATVDAAGGALAAIQGLNQELNERDETIRKLEQLNAKLPQRLEKVERRLDCSER